MRSRKAIMDDVVYEGTRAKLQLEVLLDIRDLLGKLEHDSKYRIKMDR